MKTLIATLLATAAGASFAAAPTFGLNHDPATYRNMSQKVEADYKAAVAKCETARGNDKDVCMAEAKVARTRTEVDALARYNNSPKGREKMRTEVADAEYNLAKARCGAKSGADKDECVNNAKSVHTAALAEAKSTSNASTATGASTAGATAAAAVDKCAQGGDAKTGCLVDTKPPAVRDSVAEAADKTNAVAAATVEKTKEATANLTEKAAEKTADATAKTRVVAADTAITTKVKAGLVKEPDLSSLGIHVETEKGVVMLSGFVRSKTEAEKAVKVAKNVDGVSNVKSAILVK